MSKEGKLRNSLAPGEVRILQALLARRMKNKAEDEQQSKGMSNSELQKAIGNKNPNYLSDYLKRLRKKGLVSRDIETREYVAIGINPTVLELHSIIRFIEERLAIAERKGLANAYISYPKRPFSPIPLMSENFEMFKRISKSSEQHGKKTLPSLLNEIKILLFSFEESVALGSFSKHEQKSIKKYQDCMEHLVLFSERYRSIFEKCRKNFLDEMTNGYPNMTPTDDFIEDNARAQAKQELDRVIRFYKVMGTKAFLIDFQFGRTKIRNDFKPEEKKLVDDLISYIENNENRKLYEDYLAKIEASPKTLIIVPTGSFGPDEQDMLASLGISSEEAVEEALG